jgi:hypothetical protein
MNKLIILATIMFISLSMLTEKNFAQDQQKSPCDGKAIVYVFSSKAEGTIGRVVSTMLVDGKEIAKISPNKYLILLLNPGEHEIHFKAKDTGAGMNFEAGKEYYFKVDWFKSGFGGMVRAGGITVVLPEAGRYSVKKLGTTKSDEVAKGIIDKTTAYSLNPCS